MIVDVPPVQYEQLRQRKEAEPSADIQQRVNAARKRQLERFGERSGMCNARMGPNELRRFCRLDEASDQLMHMAFDSMGLTARSYDRILRVARTIADLEGTEDIRPEHIAEAIQYRKVNL